MSDATSTRFSCDGCGRTYAWKESLAGKRVKCKCGQAMTVPDAPPEPEFDADALYALADAEREAAANAPSQHRIVDRPAAVKAATGNRGNAIPRGAAGLALGYQRGATAREIERGNSVIDMPRDLYVPLALFIVGLAIYVSYYAVHYQLRSSAIAGDRKSTRLNSSHMSISYAVFCLKKKKEVILELHVLSIMLRSVLVLMLPLL